ncbi:complex I NDUFA9 subunit family protein [uncultured Desulfuromusa sp.]|uniref:complex I NDUFA9 subunit family protein n=1 Tax=uncultured Desulfuromusa sp. TaxID=219183 RepID=UPI002AA8DAC2|nr:complex I NDUFA9 subunit family protein [uncultured Desulfuromusa sp.]
MKVFITGGSGFVGRTMIRQLLNDGHSVCALVRTEGALADFDGVEEVVGDTTRSETLQEQLSGCDAVIHLVGIIREIPSQRVTFEKLHVESTENILQAAVKQGVKRFLQMSANGTRSDAITRYHQTKWEAEEMVRRTSLDWTIFRPSLIYGPGDQFINMLAQLIKTLPVVPVMGDGRYQLQPVHVTDVAAGFVQALEKQETIGKTYQCCGSQVFSYDQLLDAVAQGLGRGSGVRKIHQPLWLMKPVVAAMQSIPQFPMTSDQLQMLLEGNICSDSCWQDDLCLEIHDFPSSIRAYLQK